MKKITEIESLEPNSLALRTHLKAPPSTIYIISVDIKGNIAYVNWAWSKDSDNYFHTDFRKSEGIADAGFWHELTTQNYKK
jgi:hypothetical protein